MIFYLARSHAKSVVRLFAVSFLIEGFAKLALQTKKDAAATLNVCFGYSYIRSNS